MARVTIEDCLEKVENRFVLVHMAAKRAKMLLEKDQPTLLGMKNKETTLSLREIAAGNVTAMDRPQQRSRARNLSARRRTRKK